jgi:Protein of unknown function (DUF2867)
LGFCVRPRGGEGPAPGPRSELVQTAYFFPVPFWGRLYWNLSYPFHRFIFRGMARNIVRAAEQQEPRNCPGGRVAL